MLVCMEQAILDFNTQFGYVPKVVGPALPRKERYVVAGMGGSHLAADVLKEANPFSDITVWSDYGLPPIPKERLHDYLFVASSYSGNTEETLDFARVAFEGKHTLVCIAVGGKLIDFAQKNDIPYLQLPDTKIQPRSALGFSILAMTKAMGFEGELDELARLADKLKPEHLRNEGKALADTLKGSIPVIYASAANRPVAYNWKIKMNETVKIPAFYNVFPELNHNEMTGFDVIRATRPLSDTIHFIFLADAEDHPQVRRRFEITEKLYQDRGLSVTTLWLLGQGRFEKIFRSLLLADWTAFHLSQMYGTEAEAVPMVEEFKKLVTHN